MAMKCKLCFPGQGPLCHTAFSLGRVTQTGGRQGLSRDPRVCLDLWTEKAPEAWLSKGHDDFKEDEVMGLGWGRG